MQINVRGGTNAGWKVQQPKIEPWVCAICDFLSKYSRCLSCGAQKPER